MMSKEPLAVVTRNNDREFSDVINWVVHALFYGEEQGITKTMSRCQQVSNLTEHTSDLDFMNAVYCVGNYGEILSDEEKNNQGMNQINNGTTGMLYAMPFGDLERNSGVVDANTALEKIRKKGLLECGVVVPDGYTGDISNSDKLIGMNVSFCRALAAALFHGNFKAVRLVKFSEKDISSLESLGNGTIDVLAGRRVERKYDFESSPSLGGFHFSTPFYHGNEKAGEDASFFALATREYDVLLSSFVNCVVLATFYAQENFIVRLSSREMPLMTIFGSEFKWALKDTISYSGSYGQIYEEHFGNVAEENRGRNILNEGGPQLHSFPGLHP